MQVTYTKLNTHTYIITCTEEKNYLSKKQKESPDIRYMAKNKKIMNQLLNMNIPTCKKKEKEMGRDNIITYHKQHKSIALTLAK